MRFLTKVVYSACFLLLISIANISFAAVAGKVIMVTGTATATDAQGVKRTLQRRSDIHEQDVITTAANSRIQIRFIDNALLTLQPNSQINIREYQLAQMDSTENKVLMDLVEGGFRSLTGTIGKGTPEAYKVNTPTASIGIRGTLYSVLIQGDTLLAGVWQGGISLNTPDGGQYNLGEDSAYRFARLSPTGLIGLLAAPAELDVAPAADEDGINAPNTANDDSSVGNSESNQLSNSNTESTQEEPLHTPANESSLNIAPLEQLDEEAFNEELSEVLEAANSDNSTGSDPVPVDPNPTPTQPSLISATPEEIGLHGSSDQVVFAIDSSQALNGRLIENSQGEHVFISQTNDGEYVLRFSEPALTSNDEDSNGAVTVGTWTTLPTSYSGAVSEQYRTAPSSFFYYTATPFELNNPPTGLDSLTFNYALPLQGYDNFGNALTSAEGSFELNFGSGNIGDGFLSLIYEPSQGDYGTEWNIQFDVDGQWNNGPQVRLNILEAWVSLKKNGDSYDYGDIDANDSDNYLNLILTNDGDDYWALMLAQLNALTYENDEQLSASSLLLWGNIPEIHSQLDSIDQTNYLAALQSGQYTYATLGETIYEGFMFTGANSSDLRFMTAEGELFKYSGSTGQQFPPTALMEDWGRWNIVNNPNSLEFYADDGSDNNTAELPSGQDFLFITAKRFTDWSSANDIYEFQVGMSENDLVALGKDSLGNPLTQIRGSLRVDLSTGTISGIDTNGGVGGNLEFKYETNANAFTEWSFSLSGDINNIVVSPTSLTHNGSSGDFDSAQFNAFVIGQSAVEGVLSQHIFEGSSTAPIWANGLVVWKKTP